MNSTMMTDAYANHTTALDKPAKAKLFQQAVCYHDVRKCVTPEKLRSAYQVLLVSAQAALCRITERSRL